MTKIFDNENFLKMIVQGPNEDQRRHSASNPLEEKSNNSKFLQNESNKLKLFLREIVRKKSIEEKDENNTSNSKIVKLNPSANKQNDSNKSNNLIKSTIFEDSIEPDNTTILHLFNKNLNVESYVKYKEDDGRNLRKLNTISDSETSQDELIQNMTDDFVLNTSSFYYNVWETILSLTLFYIFVFDIYIFSFFDEEDAIFSIVSVVIDSIYVVDFIKCFYVPFLDNEENMIKNRKLIFYHYLNNGFFIDLITGIPFSIFITAMNNQDGTSHLKFIRIAKISRISKLTRILKLTKLAKTFKRDNNTFKLKIIEDLNISSNMKRFAKFGIYFLLFTHISSCLWVFVAKLDYPNWITNTNSTDIDYVSLYIEAFYFNVTTIFTVGYGDITPYHVFERLYNMILMIFGVFLYSFTITSLSNIIAKMEKKEKQYNKRVDFLEEIKMKYKLDQNLHKILFRFLTYDLQINRINKKMILDELPQQLQFHLIMQIYQKPIKILKMFQNTPSDFKFKAVTMLKQLKMLKGEYLIKSGDFLEETYFIKKGVLQVEFNINKYKSYGLIRLYRREHFGDVYMCRNIRSPVGVYVFSSSAEMYLLGKKDFISLHEEFPDIIQKMIKTSLFNSTKLELKARDIILKQQADNETFTLIDKSKTFIGIKNNSMLIENASPVNSILSKFNRTSDIRPERIRLSEELSEDRAHNLQLIDFNTNKLPVINEDNSSADESSSIVSSIRNNDTIKSESEHSSSNNTSKRHINISYNINIQNNVNFSSKNVSNISKEDNTDNNPNKDSYNFGDNFTSKKESVINFMAPGQMFQNLTEMTIDAVKDIEFKFNDKDKILSYNDDELKSSLENKQRVSILKGTENDNPIIRKRVSITNFSSPKNPGTKRYTIDSTHPDKTHISEEIEKVSRSSLFNNLFTNKSKRRLTKFAITPIQTTEKRSNSVFDLSKKKKSIVKIDTISEQKRQSYSPSKRIRKLSESHYNEILTNMKKDAFFFLNPLSILGNNELNTCKAPIIEKHVDRAVDIFETIMKCVIKNKVKY